MNIRAQPIIEDRITRLFSVADVKAMVAAGIMAEDERVELIEGVLVEMAAKNRSHELIKNWIVEQAILKGAGEYRVSVEGTLYLADETFVEPDILFHGPGTVVTDVKGPQTLLAIEVADASLRYDLGRKAQIYATYGVRELWVIDATRRETHVHLRASVNGYATVDIFDADFEVRPKSVPNFTMRLSEVA